MKKIILSFVLILGLMFSTTFSYNLNTKDTQLVNKINRKFDLIYKNAPKKIEDIYEKVQELLNIKFKGKENTRIYTIINGLNIHLEEILNKEIDEEEGDLEKLLFGKQEKIKIKNLSTNNKKEIVKRLENGEHCFILVKGQNNEIKDYCFNEELKIFLKKGGKCSELKIDSLSKEKCLKLEGIKKSDIKNKIYTDTEMKKFLNDGGKCEKFNKYSLNEYRCKKNKKNIDKDNNEVNNYNYSNKGRKGVYKYCQTGPRGGRYYINSNGKKVYNCD